MSADITGDGAFTISDVWAWAEFIGCWPGNTALVLLSDTAVGRFFELSPWDQYGTLAWVVSVAVWLVVLGFVAAAGNSNS